MKGGNNIKIIIARILIIIFSVCLVISSYFIFKEYYEYKKSKKLNNELIEEVFIEDNSNNYCFIDWERLNSINKDIIGWITIDGTNINYPILQDNEDLKYLNKSYDKKYSRSGSIFTLNYQPFDDKITIIYGHNMKNGQMFSELVNFLDEEYLSKHSKFEIYTKNKKYQATIFSCYTMDVKKEEKNIKMLSPKEEIQYYKDSSIINVQEVKDIEKIIKLSTCSYINSHTTPTNERCYVIAKIENI